MPKTKPNLKIASETYWMHKNTAGIDFFLNKSTRKCGIHIRGLAKLCGVDESTIRGVFRKSEKARGDLRGLRESELYKILKDRDIFLRDLRGLSPILNGKEVKVILADVCFDVAHYYARKGYKEALDTIGKMGRFGTEQFIMIQVGFIPRPESIMLDDIEYLIAKELVQVNKSRQEEARFFTNPITGECGIALKSLGFLCGGVAIKHIQAFVEAQNEPYLQADHPEQIVKASVCYQVLQHFGYKHKPRKTVAQHWAKTLDPITPTLHQKTNYQIPSVTKRETQLEQQNIELQAEVARLKQLLKEEETTGRKKLHRLMGQVLQWTVPQLFYEVRLEEDTSHIAQLLDGLILKRLPQQQLPKNFTLPDGLTLDADINLLTYKSQHESLTFWTIQELIGHYVGYRKILKAKHPKRTLPDAQQFALYAVTTMFPQELVKQVGTAWEATDKAGVYHLLTAGLAITVIVLNEITTTQHNRPWNLLSSNQEVVNYALNQDEPLPDDLLLYFKVNS
ncbi:hypothetical protein TI05_08290 [Achromatium sp. WMS3]|nr:hypothetical protein TI05_08290 [Achromatium sp. WMS3]